MSGISTWRHYWVKVWPWKDAPPKYKKLWQKGRQPEWIAIVSKAAARSPRYKDIPWLEEGMGFGTFVSEHKMKDGSIAYLGVRKGMSL